MAKTIITEGKTTNEAIEKGLKELKVSRECVDVKVIDEDKRSFFSILAPRVVKVEMTLKDCENAKKADKVCKKKDISLSEDEQRLAKRNIEEFLNEFIKNIPEDAVYDIKTDEKAVFVEINNEKLGYLIGYRGETLYSFQNILAIIANKGIEQKVRVILDIEGYKAKREKTLEELASKVAKTVVKTRKPVTLEPMQAYERKIIHTKLQNHRSVDTVSIGEEPYRKIVISLKEKNK